MSLCTRLVAAPHSPVGWALGLERREPRGTRVSRDMQNRETPAQLELDLLSSRALSGVSSSGKTAKKSSARAPLGLRPGHAGNTYSGGFTPRACASYTAQPKGAVRPLDKVHVHCALVTVCYSKN